MNDLESLLARINAFNAKAQSASDTMTALANEHRAIIADGQALGLKYRKLVPMLAAVSFDILLPAPRKPAEAQDEPPSIQAAE